MTAPQPLDLLAALDQLAFLADGTPSMGETDIGWARQLAGYRDGGIFGPGTASSRRPRSRS